MQVLSGQEVDLAVQALLAVGRYDTMRVKTYRRKENLGDRIFVSPIGSAVALRFDDVGYFNRVYCADESVFEMVPEIEAFYRGGPFGCELVGPPVAESERARRIAHLVGGRANRYEWRYADV